MNVQHCVKCNLNITLSCFKHMESVRNVCVFPGQPITVFGRLKIEETMNVYSKFAKFGGDTAQSNQLKWSKCSPNVNSTISMTATVTKKEKAENTCAKLIHRNKYSWKASQHIQEWLMTLLPSNEKVKIEYHTKATFECWKPKTNSLFRRN